MPKPPELTPTSRSDGSQEDASIPLEFQKIAFLPGDRQVILDKRKCYYYVEDENGASKVKPSL